MRSQLFTMKKLLFFTLMFPVFAFAQTKPKTATKTATKAAVPAKKLETKAWDGFTINAHITGFPEGTSVSLLNGQTGAPESETTISKHTFSFKGKVTNPDFKILLFNKQPPYITLFLDNSVIKIEGSKDAIDSVVVNGSVSNADFNKLTSKLAPYQKVFAENAPYDAEAVAGAKMVTADFVKQNSSSFIAPLAVIRFSQLTDETAKTEELYNLLSPEVKQTPMGNYVAQQITDLKRNAIGTELADFTQADTTGKQVHLSDFRGKYVLIDFWASWCRPCRQENPNVVANFNKYKGKGFTVLGVSLDKTKPAWVDAIKMDGLTWDHVSDLQGWTNSVAQQFQITSIPQNFLIGPDGKIIGKNLRGPELERKLEAILK